MKNTAFKRQTRIPALLLAAGSSSRFGDDNKLLANWRSEPLIHHALLSIAESNVDSITVVTGHQHELVVNAINRVGCNKPIQMIYNNAYQTGMASSLTHGVSTLKKSDAIVVCLGDMPNATSNVINKLIQAFVQNPAKALYIPVHQGQRGNPVLIANCLFNSVLKLQGDIGARALAQQKPEMVQEVHTECLGIHQDIDTPEELSDL